MSKNFCRGANEVGILAAKKAPENHHRTTEVHDPIRLRILKVSASWPFCEVLVLRSVYVCIYIYIYGCFQK